MAKRGSFTVDASTTGAAFEKACEKNMLLIRDMIIALSEVTSRAGRACERRRATGRQSQYPDTPRNWQDRLETAFLSTVGSGR